jgi:hypothetical protein
MNKYRIILIGSVIFWLIVVIAVGWQILLRLAVRANMASFLMIAVVSAAEPEDKELQILQLQKIIAEQSMAQLMRDEMVKEYVRIRGNYDKLNADIEAKEKARGKKSE